MQPFKASDKSDNQLRQSDSALSAESLLLKQTVHCGFYTRAHQATRPAEAVAKIFGIRL